MLATFFLRMPTSTEVATLFSSASTSLFSATRHLLLRIGVQQTGKVAAQNLLLRVLAATNFLILFRCRLVDEPVTSRIELDVLTHL